VRRDAAPQERSDEHGGAAHGLGWGWPTDDEERAAEPRAWERLRVFRVWRAAGPRDTDRRPQPRAKRRRWGRPAEAGAAAGRGGGQTAARHGRRAALLRRNGEDGDQTAETVRGGAAATAGPDTITRERRDVKTRDGMATSIGATRAGSACDRQRGA